MNYIICYWKLFFGLLYELYHKKKSFMHLGTVKIQIGPKIHLLETNIFLFEKYLSEALLKSTHNIRFGGEI